MRAVDARDCGDVMLSGGASLRGVRSSISWLGIRVVEGLANLDGVNKLFGFVGDGVGVVRRLPRGEEEGDSCLRKGELRGEP